MEFYDYENHLSNIEKEKIKLDKDFKAMHRLWEKAMNRENKLIEENKLLKQQIDEYELLERESDNYHLQLIEADDKIALLKQELYNKSNKVIELQMQLYDANIMKTRLLKILNETSDHT